MTEEVEGFKRLVKFLHVQGVSTKIESSRLGSNDNGFINLAENIDSQSFIISEKAHKFRGETEALINLINNVRFEEIRLKKEQRKYSETIIQNSSESLNLLFNKNKESSSKYEIIYSNFQDIQKISVKWLHPFSSMI